MTTRKATSQCFPLNCCRRTCPLPICCKDLETSGLPNHSWRQWPYFCTIKTKTRDEPMTLRSLHQSTPLDVHVHITSFLHPNVALSFSCVFRSYRAVVDESDTSRAIWRTLWARNYARVVNVWPGKEALRRSALEATLIVTKTFTLVSARPTWATR